jgi:hypothetical protein
MECAESAFGLGRPEDYRWHAEHPGESPTNDLVHELEGRGCLVVVEGFDEETQRVVARAEITKDGRRRMNKLVAEGVQPSAGQL